MSKALRKRYGRSTLSGSALGGHEAQGASYFVYRVMTDRVGDEHHVVWQGANRAEAGKQYEKAVLAARKVGPQYGRLHAQIQGQTDPRSWRILQAFDTYTHE